MSNDSGSPIQDLFNSSDKGEKSRYAGMTRTVKGEDKAPVFRVKPLYDSRKVKGWDMMEALKKPPVAWSVSNNAVMPADQAGDMMLRIQKAYGLDRSEPDVILAFRKSLLFYHTINSASVLAPDRAKLYVNGEEISAYEAVKILGADNRRFFRAFADDVREVNREVIEFYDPSDMASAEKFEWLTAVAADRGLATIPDLAHDTADACSGLDFATRHKLANSKNMVFGTIIDSVGRYQTNTRGTLADDYDSTNMVTVPNSSRK